MPPAPAEAWPILYPAAKAATATNTMRMSSNSVMPHPPGFVLSLEHKPLSQINWINQQEMRIRIGVFQRHYCPRMAIRSGINWI